MKDRCCPKCGCTEIVEGGRIYEDTGRRWRNLGVTVYANPDAWLFTGEVTSTLTVSVCGSCGYAELYVKNPQALLEAYRKQPRPAEEKQPAQETTLPQEQEPR